MLFRSCVFRGNPNSNSNRYKQISNLNLYAGGLISYNINKSIRIKAGLEFRYSKSSFSDGFDNPENSSFRNNINAQDNFTAKNLVQNSNMEFNTYNISFPVGTDFELAGNNNIQWYAGASIEPTLNLNDNVGYVYQNETNNSDLKIRNWNLNSNIETYLSLKINNKTFFNAGPQFRYQWFSTYENMLNSNGKTYNLGMKFGVSKTF